jgi:hypothetical protein
VPAGHASPRAGRPELSYIHANGVNDPSRARGTPAMDQIAAMRAFIPFGHFLAYGRAAGGADRPFPEG